MGFRSLEFTPQASELGLIEYPIKGLSLSFERDRLARISVYVTEDVFLGRLRYYRDQYYALPPEPYIGSRGPLCRFKFRAGDIDITMSACGKTSTDYIGYRKKLPPRTFD